MSYINFDKNQLVNLEYSLDKELVRSNRSGSFACATIIGCNTRKYHGLLISPQPNLDNQTHVLLSKVDETVIQHDAEFNIGINKYPGTYNPKGHKYIRDFSADNIPVITFRVGNLILTKEMMLVTEEERVLIKYTVVQNQSPTKLRLQPFLAFRPIHSLSKKNFFVNTKYQNISNGIKIKPYEGFSYLHLQLSKEDYEYIHVPDWYENIEYIKESERGYENQEDLFVPGFFELNIKKGESVVFSASTREINPNELPKLFENELQQRTPRNNFENCLANSAEQFFFKKSNFTEIVAGYPWYDRVGRYTFLSLPGLTLSLNDPITCKEVLDSMISKMQGPVFPETENANNESYGTADTSLWFIWALQQYTYFTSSKKYVWENYGNIIIKIIEGFTNSNNKDVAIEDNNLLYCNNPELSLTWMNAMIEGKPVIRRFGYIIEVNALWYNAIKFALELAEYFNDQSFIQKWKPIAETIPHAFTNTFWDETSQSVADYVTEDEKDLSIRPNQILATSLPYNPLSEPIRMHILETCKNDLLTPRGLRTLSPKDVNYKGSYAGDATKREKASFQGIAWPWLVGHFAEGYLKILKENGVEFIKTLYHGFEDTMKEAGIGTLSEIYEGDPPHKACGAISFAPSVAELLRINSLIKRYENLNTNKETKNAKQKVN